VREGTAEREAFVTTLMAIDQHGFSYSPALQAMPKTPPG